MTSRPLTAAALRLAFLLPVCLAPGVALAVLRFECARYQAPGNLYWKEADTKKTAKARFLPTLVLHEGSSSEMRIPVQVRDSVLDRIRAVGVDPLRADFTFEVKEEGIRPSSGQLLEYGWEARKPTGRQAGLTLLESLKCEGSSGD